MAHFAARRARKKAFWVSLWADIILLPLYCTKPEGIGSFLPKVPFLKHTPPPTGSAPLDMFQTCFLTRVHNSCHDFPTEFSFHTSRIQIFFFASSPAQRQSLGKCCSFPWVTISTTFVQKLSALFWAFPGLGEAEIIWELFFAIIGRETSTTFSRLHRKVRNVESSGGGRQKNPPPLPCFLWQIAQRSENNPACQPLGWRAPLYVHIVLVGGRPITPKILLPKRRIDLMNHNPFPDICTSFPVTMIGQVLPVKAFRQRPILIPFWSGACKSPGIGFRGLRRRISISPHSTALHSKRLGEIQGMKNSFAKMARRQVPPPVDCFLPTPHSISGSQSTFKGFLGGYPMPRCSTWWNVSWDHDDASFSDLRESEAKKLNRSRMPALSPGKWIFLNGPEKGRPFLGMICAASGTWGKATFLIPPPFNKQKCLSRNCTPGRRHAFIRHVAAQSPWRALWTGSTAYGIPVPQKYWMYPWIFCASLVRFEGWTIYETWQEACITWMRYHMCVTNSWTHKQTEDWRGVGKDDKVKLECISPNNVCPIRRAI